jgi:hypothetical protein
VETVTRRLGPGSGLSGPSTAALAEALDLSLDDIERTWAALAEDLVRVVDPSRPVPGRAALRAVGAAIGLAEDPSWTEAEYRYAVLARADSRASYGTIPELVLFAQARSPLGDGTADGQPVEVRAYVAGALSLSLAEQAIIVREFLCAIPDVAGLTIVASTIADAAGIFTLDIGPGLDVGKLAGQLYP